MSLSHAPKRAVFGRAEHPQVPEYNPHLDENVEIDMELQPVLSRLWKAGIRTSWSCQGTPNHCPEHSAYITFPSTEDADRFLNLAADALGLQGCNAVMASGIGLIVGTLPEGVSISLPRVYMEATANLGDEGWAAQITIRFPPERVADLAEALR